MDRWIPLHFICMVLALLSYRWFLQRDNSESVVEMASKVLNTLCDQYRNGTVSGNLCHKICDASNAGILRSCLRNKFIVSLAIEKNETIVLKSDRLYFDQYDTVPDFVSEAEFEKRIVERVFKNTGMVWNGTIPLFDWVWSTGTPGNLSLADRRSIWALLDQEEYVNFKILHSTNLFPAVLGSCGHIYAVPVWQPISFLQTLYSSVLVHTLNGLENVNGEMLHWCDVGSTNLGLNVHPDSSYVILDADLVFTESRMNNVLSAFNCTTDADCMFFDCHAKCNYSTGFCSNRFNSNRQTNYCATRIDDIHTGNLHEHTSAVLILAEDSTNIELANNIHCQPSKHAAPSTLCSQGKVSTSHSDIGTGHRLWLDDTVALCRKSPRRPGRNGKRSDRPIRSGHFAFGRPAVAAGMIVEELQWAPVFSAVNAMESPLAWMEVNQDGGDCPCVPEPPSFHLGPPPVPPTLPDTAMDGLSCLAPSSDDDPFTSYSGTIDGSVEVSPVIFIGTAAAVTAVTAVAIMVLIFLLARHNRKRCPPRTNQTDNWCHCYVDVRQSPSFQESCSKSDMSYYSARPILSLQTPTNYVRTTHTVGRMMESCSGHYEEIASDNGSSGARGENAALYCRGNFANVAYVHSSPHHVDRQRGAEYFLPSAVASNMPITEGPWL